MATDTAVGIVGSGPIGQALAKLWAQAGYNVTLGTRSVASGALVNLPSSVRLGSFEDAAHHDVVVLAGSSRWCGERRNGPLTPITRHPSARHDERSDSEGRTSGIRVGIRADRRAVDKTGLT